ncbi:choice-of-anchor Q domain-containing protein [Haloferula chungangensis]|uniref:Choice-of-anchor Q domain-containing protein n=1 Tax=Haloferula chungangensis TaxID=1048331 RepID=A0ABW2L545_9BACT
MTTTPAKKHSCRRRSVVLSRTHCRALRRRGEQSLGYWRFITHCFTSQRRRSSYSLFAFFKRMRTALGALAFAFWLPAVAQAETFTVTTASDISAADDGQLTLREAIHSANESPGPDTIDFAEELSGGILTLAQGELVISDHLAINASSLAESPIIDADQKSRVINFTAAEGDLELTHLSLRSGMVTEDDSLGERGGGILFGSSGELTLMASTISGNSAVGGYAYGGGICSDSGAITITNSTISGNSATGIYGQGGGVYTDSGAVTLTNSTLSENSAAGVYGDGGGIHSSGAITLSNSTLSGNSATGYYEDDGGGYGGGISSSIGAVTLTNSTVTGNFTAGPYSSGGGILARSGPCILANSIIAGNFIEKSALGLESIASDLDSPSDPANHLEVSHCLIGNSTGARLEDAKVNVNNLTDADPLLEPLADNGGPTQTHALASNSPAIDQGNTTGPDQRGFPRIDNPFVSNAAGGNGSDIGAFERSAAILVSDPGDVTDRDYSAGNCTLREAIDVANADPLINEIGFLDSLSGQVIRLTQGELVVTDDLLIDASSLAIAPVIDADQQSRGIHFTAPTGDLDLNQLTLRNGNTSGPNEPGGGILFSSAGKLTITRSTLSGNSTTGTHSPGGGIYSESGSLTLSNSTFSGNSTNGAGSHGGGVASGTGSVTLSSCTLGENIASGSGGGLHGGNSKLTLLNTLIANNADDGTAPDLSAPENPAMDLEISHSLIGNSTGAGLDEAKVNQSNLIDVDPLLEALGDHGGPTQTHPLAAGSPAIDQRDTTGTDQRGILYADDPNIPNLNGSNGSDIGAFEREVILIVSDASDEMDDDFSDGSLTLREAILLTNKIPGNRQIHFRGDLSGAVITLTPETSTERDSHKGDLMITDGLIIDASDLAEAPVIDGDGQSRIISFNAWRGDLTLTNLVLRNGSAPSNLSGTILADGGGIHFRSNGSLNVISCILSDNRANHGGGIFSEGGSITLSDSMIIRNESVESGYYGDRWSGIGFHGGRTYWVSIPGHGGGIYTNNGIVTLNNSTVSDNSATGEGGGIYTESGEVMLRNSTFEGNQAGLSFVASGGGIYTLSGAVTLSNSTLSGNSVVGYGGGIYSRAGNIVLTNSTLSDNCSSNRRPYQGSGGGASATTQCVGGGIATDSGAVTLTNSTLSGNSSKDADHVFGGGIHTSSGAITLTNSTVSGNSIIGYYGTGGGINSRSGTVTLSNSIIANNTSKIVGSEAIASDLSGSSPANHLDVSHCLIGNSSGARLDEAKVNLNNLTDIDPLLAPLADNGGGTWTMLPFPGSPVINAGTTTDLSTDQRGFAHAGLPDIGAVEYQGSPDLSRIADSDFDDDGQVFIIEQALGTDPFLADSNNSRLLSPTLDPEGYPMLSFGIADDAASGTLWALERSSDLVSFEEIYRFDGIIHFDFTESTISVEIIDTGVTITDLAPPAGAAFYRINITFDATE